MNNDHKDFGNDGVDKPKTPAETANGGLPETEKEINWKSAFIFAVIFVVIIAATFTFLRMSTELRFKNLPKIIAEMNIWYVLGGFACLGLYIFAEGRSFVAIAKAIGVKLNTVKAMRFTCVEMFFSGITPSASGGQPAVAYFMSKEGIKLSKSSAILLTNTLHYTVSLLFLSTGTLFYSRDLIIAESARNGTFKLFFILGFIANCFGFACCLLFIFAPGLIRLIARPIYKFLAKIRIIRDLDAKLASLDIAIADYNECHRLIRNSPFSQFKAFFWNVVQKSSSCAVAFFVYRALGYTELGLVDIISIHLIIIMAVNALPLPGSAGASELIINQLYMSIYTPIHAIPAMIFYRTISFYALVIITGVVSVAYYYKIMKAQVKRVGKLT